MQFTTHKCLQTYQCLFVSINILFVAHILLLPTPAPHHDNQRMLNLATNTRGEWKRWWIEMLNMHFPIGNSKSAEISSGSSSYVYYMFSIPFSTPWTTWCDNERRGSRSKSSSIIAPNPRSGERSWDDSHPLWSWDHDGSLTALTTVEPLNPCWCLIWRFFLLTRIGCFFFSGSSRALLSVETSFQCRIGEETYGYQQWYMENIQLGLEQA